MSTTNTSTSVEMATSSPSDTDEPPQMPRTDSNSSTSTEITLLDTDTINSVEVMSTPSIDANSPANLTAPATATSDDSSAIMNISRPLETVVPFNATRTPPRRIHVRAAVPDRTLEEGTLHIVKPLGQCLTWITILGMLFTVGGTAVLVNEDTFIRSEVRIVATVFVTIGALSLAVSFFWSLAVHCACKKDSAAVGRRILVIHLPSTKMEVYSVSARHGGLHMPFDPPPPYPDFPPPPPPYELVPSMGNTILQV